MKKKNIVGIISGILLFIVTTIFIVILKKLDVVPDKYFMLLVAVSYIVTIITDSKYVSDQINRGNLRVLISNQKKKNLDLWEKVLNLSKKHTLSAKWVKGHAGNKLNEKCDALANEEVRKLEREKDIRHHTIAELLLNPAESPENIARRYPGSCSVKTVQKYYEQFMEKSGGL